MLLRLRQRLSSSSEVMMRRPLGRTTTFPTHARAFGSAPSPTAMVDKLEGALKSALGTDKVKVEDVSGGCGSFFSIEVTSPLFNSISVVAQHRLVTEAIKDDIKGFHGVTIKTKKAS